MTWKEFAHYNYLIGIGMMAIAMPIFNLGMSIATFYIAGVWVVDLFHDWLWKKTPWVKFNSFAKDRAAQGVMAFYALFAIGLLYSSNWEYGIHDLKIKAPLFIIPLSLSMVLELNMKELRGIIMLFILSVVFSVSCALLVRFHIVDIAFQDVREVTRLFITRISHVRLSLMVALGSLLSIWLYATLAYKKGKHLLFLIALNLYFLLFLISIKSGNGLVILSLGVLLLAFVLKPQQLSWVRPLRWTVVGLMILTAGYVGYCVHDFFNVNTAELEHLESHTANGEPYKHKLYNKQIENGHYVWIYYAPEEMAEAWSMRSDLSVDSSDARGQHLKATLIRYLTSRGLRKDRAGVEALSEDDVERIERGIASVTEGRKFPIKQRIDDVIYELHTYVNGSNPGGNSVTQRIEYWKAALRIIAQHPWIGVGTGDVQDSFDRMYAEMDTPLAEQYHLRAHNQYLTSALTLGIPIALLFLWLIIRLTLRAYRKRQIPALLFLVVSLLSFIPEDTLETQAGVSFFAFFIAVLLKDSGQVLPEEV
ncbi:MAG: O-antigen ligase family protein [Flavobacteriales bacterium]|nr:O-antigen ligase family protein [Flavobacteriales bacterium]